MSDRKQYIKNSGEIINESFTGQIATCKIRNKTTGKVVVTATAKGFTKYGPEGLARAKAVRKMFRLAKANNWGKVFFGNDKHAKYLIEMS